MRMLPFFATFAVGLFIASFFITVSAPNFRGGRGRRHEVKQLRTEVQQLRVEKQELADEVMRLKSQIASQDWDSSEIRHPGDEDVREFKSLAADMPTVPAAPTAPAIPVAPKAPKSVK